MRLDVSHSRNASDQYVSVHQAQDPTNYLISNRQYCGDIHVLVLTSWKVHTISNPFADIVDLRAVSYTHLTLPTILRV